MASFAQNPDERLAALTLPLRSLGIDCDVTIDHLPTASDRVFGPRQVFSDQQASSRTQFALVDVGQIACVCGRTSPIVSIQEQPERATLFLCYAGQPHYREGRLHLPLRPGSILVNPNHGGQYRSRFSTNLCFRVQRQTLQRTILAMSGLRIDSVLVEPEVWGLDAARTGTKLFDLFGFIDQLLARDRNLPTALGLDDQIHRILALLILTREGHADRLEQRSPRRLASLSRLDDLVDYIRANRARALTLTDLGVPLIDSSTMRQRTEPAAPEAEEALSGDVVEPDDEAPAAESWWEGPRAALVEAEARCVELLKQRKEQPRLVEDPQDPGTSQLAMTAARTVLATSGVIVDLGVEDLEQGSQEALRKVLGTVIESLDGVIGDLEEVADEQE